MAKKNYIIPIFIPHQGCPHECSFCNQRKIAGEFGSKSKKDIMDIIYKYLDIYPKSADNNIEIAFYGGSFTGLPIDKQIELLKPAYEMKKKGYIQKIRLSTRPDYINKNVLSLLTEYGVSIIELGIQSTDDYVLLLNKRGHTRHKIFQAVQLLKQYPFKLGLQMMVGLLGDNINTIQKTAEDIILLKPDFIRIYPTVVIKDTYLETLYLNGKYKPFTLDETVYICKNLLLLFKKNNIPIIRLGLQSTEDIAYGKAIVAGPYHPAFREIVESQIYRDLIEDKLKEHKIDNSGELIIYCNPTLISRVVGYKSFNKEYLIKKYNFHKVTIKHNKNLKKDCVDIQIY